MIKISKASSFIFFLLIFLLPTQLGRHFWPSWSLVNGVRVDYLAPTIYVTDILIFVLLFMSFLRKQESYLLQNSNNRKAKQDSSFRWNDKKGVLIFLIALGVILAVNFSPLSLIKFFKIIEIFIFAYLVKNHLTKKTYSQFIFVLSLSLLFQSGLAIAQFFDHGSLNGIFYWFGERNFSGSTPGIANASINGALILRPYGTFPHPNVLAGFLLTGIILLLSFFSSKTQRLKFPPSLKSFGRAGKIQNYFLWFIVVISSLALLFTMSRVAIGLWVILFILYFYKFHFKLKNKIFKLFLLICVVAVIFVFLQPRFFSIFGEDKQSYEDRVAQSQIAIAMFHDHPLTGVGLNQYLVQLPKYTKTTSFKDYQPVHNVFLLVLAETGLVSVLVVLFFAWRLGFSRITSGFLRIRILSFLRRQESYLIIVIIILALFDHYFYTLQQGNLMMGLILGLTIIRHDR